MRRHGRQPTRRGTAAVPPRVPCPRDGNVARGHEPVGPKGEPQPAFPSGPWLAGRLCSLSPCADAVLAPSGLWRSRFCYTPRAAPWFEADGCCFATAAVVVRLEVAEVLLYTSANAICSRVHRGFVIHLDHRSFDSCPPRFCYTRRPSQPDSRPLRFCYTFGHRRSHAAASCWVWKRRSCSAGDT
jgi:hypothetical protein